MLCKFCLIKTGKKKNLQKILFFSPLEIEVTVLEMGLGRYFSSALFLLPRVSPEFHLQKPRRQFKTHCLKLSSRMGLLPGVLRGPRRLLPGAVSLNSKGGVLLQHVSQLSLSSSSRYSGFKLLPPWHQVLHAFGSQVFIPPTTTTKGRP